MTEFQPSHPVSPNSRPDILNARLARSHCPVRVDGAGLEIERWYAVASSRLGKPIEKRKSWFLLLHRAVQQTVADGAALMIVPGTTAAEWLDRAAKFYACPTVMVTPDRKGHEDEVLVDLADRLFVLRCRKGGVVSKLVLRRLPAAGADTLVAIWADHDDGGQELLAAGAVGWWLYDPASAAATTGTEPPDYSSPINSRLPEIEGGWLIHCTRARSGPLPGQTESQWRDEVLLGGDGGRDLRSLDVLLRILKQQRIRATKQAKDQPPVVCFANLSLAELLRRRTFRQHRGRWDYEPFGFALSRRKLESLGAKPVVYADNFAQSGLAADQAWRYQSIGKTYDWSTECEWRVSASIDLSLLSVDELVIFVGDQLSAYQVAVFSRWPVILAPVNV